MGRPKKNAARSDHKLQAGALKLLWKKVPVREWHRIISKADPKGKWSIEGHNIIKGCCPYHDDTTPSFKLNFNMCLGKCFGSCGKVVTDLVNFYARISHKNYSQALLELSSQFDISEIIGPEANELPAFNNQQEMKKWAAIAMHKVLEEHLRERPRHLEYLRPALLYLTVGRKLPFEALGHLPIGVYAKPEHLKKYIPDDYHRIFDSYFSKVDGKNWWGSICFHYNDQPGSISRFKMRKLCSDAMKICQKENLTPDEAREIGAEKAFFVVDDPFISEMGVFGLHHYAHHLGPDCTTNAYITEGEFDAAAVMGQQIISGRPDFMVFAIGGNGNPGISFLREFGIRTIWTVQDAPHKNGDSVIRQLLLNSNNFVEDVDNPALQYKIFQWPRAMRGGDLDEAINLMGYEEIVKYLVLERTNFFLNSYSWVLDKCEEEVAEIQDKLKIDIAALSEGEQNSIQKENLTTTARDNIIAVVKNWFRCLHAPVGKLSFIQHYARTQQIDLSLLSEVNASIYELDTLQGAAKRIAHALKEYIDIAYYEVTQAGSQFTIFNKRTAVTHILPINDEGREVVLTQCLGRNIVDWVTEVLKGSKMLGKPTGDPFIDAINIKKRVFRIIKEAILLIYPNVALASSMIKVGQGIHHLDIKRQNGSNEDVLYFVNGDKVYKATYSETSATPCRWQQLPSCVDGGYFFMLNVQKVWSVVKDESDLYESTQVDKMKLFDDLRRILDGWKFEEHDLMRDYLAAWIMSLPIQKAIGQVNMTFVTGATTSGKTSFVRGLLGGNLNDVAFDVPSVIEGSWFSSDATAAGIYQEMDKSSLTLCLDEAEARQGTEHSERVNNFQTLAFSIPFGGSSITRGGASPTARNNYSMQMPVVMAAINMASNPTFLNRVVPVYTEKDMSRKNIGTYISENFTDEEIARIRKNVTIGLLHDIPDIVARIPKLRMRLAKVKTPVPVNDRYITILLPAMVIYDYLGLDAEDLFLRVITKNKGLIENFNSQDYHSELINAVLYTHGIRANLDGGSTTNEVSAKDLILAGEIATLNASSIGVNLLPERGWLVIFWRDVKHSLLLRTQYAGQDEAELRESVAKNKYLIHNLTEEDHKYIVKTLGRTDIKNSTQYSVISAEYMLDNPMVIPGSKHGGSGNQGNFSAQPGNVELCEIPLSAYEDEITRIQDAIMDGSEYTL